MGVFSFAIIQEDTLEQADLTSQINNERQIFTLPESYTGGSLRVYYNGIRQVIGETYNEVNDTQFSLQFTPQVGDYLTVDYAK